MKGIITLLTLLLLSKATLAEGNATAFSQFVFDNNFIEETHTLILSRDIEEAISHISRALEATQGPKREALLLWKIRLLNRIGDYSQSLKTIEDTKNHISVLSPYFDAEYKKTLVNAGQYNQALQVFQNLPVTQLGNSDFWLYASSLTATGNYDGVLSLIKERLKKNKDTAEVEHLIFFEAQTLWNKGDKDLAIKAWVNALIKNPGSTYDDDIIKIIESLGLSHWKYAVYKDWLKRCDGLIEKGLAPLAVDEYRELMHEFSEVDLRFEIATATFKARFYQDASEQFEELLNDPHFENKRGEIKAYLATAYSRSDQFDKAINFYQQALIPSAKLPFLYFDSGQYQKAKKMYESLLYGKKINEKDLWYHFWVCYLTSDFKMALADLQSLKKIKTSPFEKRQLTYLEAKVALKTGQKKQAMDLFKTLLDQHPIDYYMLIATQWIQKGHLEPLTLIDTNLANSIPSKNHGLPSSVINIPENDTVIKALLLAQIGDETNALTEATQSDLLKGGLELSDLNALLSYSHQYTRLSAIGQIVLKTNPPNMSPRAWNNAYPLAFKPAVLFYSNQVGLDPFLTLSIMRQESAFRPFVSSPALAMGLMQIIPQTGHEIADRLHVFDFHHDTLFDTNINIRFGSWYLKNRLDEFGGHLEYAIASYNAGPQAVSRWKRWGDKMEPDEFIELIPYGETSLYVKKVLANLWIYRRLYNP